jgi:hypothetical protein
VKILKNIQGRRRKSSICHLAMPVAISMARLAESLPRLREVPGGWRENPTRAV